MQQVQTETSDKVTLIAKAIRERRNIDERERQADLGEIGRSGGLLHFVRYYWHILEPNAKLIVDMQMVAICLHLEAVARGEITRLLINVSPGASKSLLVNVFFAAWLWGPAKKPWLRFVTFAYAAYLTERDNDRFRNIVKSMEFQELWSDVFKLTSDGVVKPSNDARGWKFSSSMQGVGTGERGHFILADDLHNVIEGESETVRGKTVRWAREGMSNRLNDMIEGVIIMIGQRVHDDDVSAAMMKDDLGFVHLCIPMQYDPQRHCKTTWWEDPRTDFGQLASPERFPPLTIARMERTLGPYAWAAQYQQTPQPRGGGILKREWWEPYELSRGAIPEHDFLKIASLDPAYTNKEENDPSGFTVWGAYTDGGGDSKIVLLQAWKKWLELHGQTYPRGLKETHIEYAARTSQHWGLVEWVDYECSRMGVNILLIEDRASGHSVAQEMQRLFAGKKYGVHLVNTAALDKRNRAFSIQHMFAAGMIQGLCHDDKESGRLEWRDFVELVINECEKFRGLPGDQDNLVDSTVQALMFMRHQWIAERREERVDREAALTTLKPRMSNRLLYPV